MTQPAGATVDPRLNPQVRTREQWVATMAESWTLNYANGNDGTFTSSFFSSQTWAGRGLGSINPASYDVPADSALDPSVYQGFAKAADWAYANWATLSEADRQAFTLSPTDASGKLLPDTPYIDPDLAIRQRDTTWT